MNEDAEGVAREVVARLQQAWNDGDGEAFGAPFTEDAGFVDLRGTHHPGRATIARGHQGIFDTIYRGSRIQYTVTDARALAPDVIVAHSTGHLSAPSGPMAGENDATQTLVLVREGGEWQIAAFHNTVVVPMPPR
jgi:uncharacterized protein (TIGR02246 family)